MGRIRTTIELAKASWEVLKADKELLLLPVMSGIATLIVAGTFIAAIFVNGGIEAAEAPGPVEYIMLFLLYVVLAFITIFFNAALVHAADDRLQGYDPTLATALRGATERLNRILPWALVSATVSIILRSIEERAGFLGRIVIGLIGMAWSLVTFLVLPILVIEDVSVTEALRRSTGLFKKTWGENVAAQVGFGLLGVVLVLPAIPVLFLAFLSGSGTVIVITAVAAFVWFAMVGIVITALNGIFQTALYRYATDGTVPGRFFSERSMATAFGPRQRNSLFR